MKRKTCQINSSDDPSPIRSAFPRGVRSSKTRLNTTSCLEEAKVDDNPKTSEYAFFKKFKEVAAQNQCSKFNPRDYSCRERSNIIENNSHNKGLKSSLRPENKTPQNNSVSFLSPLVNASKRPMVDMRRFDSSLADGCSSLHNMEEFGSQRKNEDADIFSIKRQKLHQLVVTSCPEVDELCAKGYDFVSALLSKLFPESNEEKSFELLKTGKLETDAKSRSLPSLKSEMHFKKSYSMPTSNFMDLEYGQSLDVDVSSRCLEISKERDLPNPNSQSHHLHRNCLDNGIMELNYELGERIAPIAWMEGDSGFDFHIEKHGSYASRLHKELAEFHHPIEPLGRELPNPNSQNHHFHRNYLDNRMMELKLGERIAPIVWMEGDTSFDFHIDKHDSLTSKHLKELPELQFPIESLLERGPCTLLLGWDFDNMTDKSNLSVHCQSADLSLLPVLSSSYGEVQKQNSGSRFTSSGLGTPSLFSYHPSNLPSLQCSPSVSNRSHTFGEQFLEVKDDILSVLNDFPLSLPHTENHLNLRGYSYCDTTSEGGGILLSPQNHLWFMRRVLNDEPGTETCFSTGVDFYFEPKCIPSSGSWRNRYSHSCPALEFPQDEGISSNFLIGDKNEKYLDDLRHREIINHFCEDKFNIQDWSSIYFQMSVDKRKACPLLLDKSQPDESQSERYFDENELKF